MHNQPITPILSSNEPPILLLDNQVGIEKRVKASDTIKRSVTIGRQGFLPVGDDDLFVHRVLLQLWFNGTSWYMKNVGKRIAVTFTIDKFGNNKTPMRFELTPGTSSPVPLQARGNFGTPACRTYQFEIKQQFQPGSSYHTAPNDVSIAGDATHGYRIFSPDQETFLTALIEPLLEKGMDHNAVPNRKELASRLGWDTKKVDNTIHRLHESLRKDGIPEFNKGSSLPQLTLLAQYAYTTHLAWKRK